METAHVNALAAKHAGLDARLAAELRRPSPDQSSIAKLKKEKLRLKEAMTRD